MSPLCVSGWAGSTGSTVVLRLSPAHAGRILPVPETSIRRAAPPLEPPALARALEAFLLEHPRACVVEEGALLFDMSGSHWTLDAANGRCVLHLWNDERNWVRTVTALEVRRMGLRLEVRRMGQCKPQVLRIVPGRDQRSSTAREQQRSRYAALLARILARTFPAYRQSPLVAATDLEHSYGPAYVRGLIERGQSTWAIVAINGEESQAAIDGLATIAALWLDHCRNHAAARRIVEGVRLIVPLGMGHAVAERIAWLHAEAAKWEVWTLDEARELLEAAEAGIAGNQLSYLPPPFDPAATLARSGAAVERVLAMLSEGERARTEALPRSPTEISLRLHGLEFARIRHGVSATSFAREDRITFGAGARETPLDEEHEAMLRDLLGQLFRSRHPAGSVRDPLFRLQPERWLEAELRADPTQLDARLRPGPIYTQVPALSSSDRGMLDLLAVTREGRLVVLELKTSEDMHMPMQGLDYWMRVRALHQDCALTRAGYFPGVELSPEAPLLFFVVPALQVHSTFDTVSRFFSPEVEWRLLALDEKWRQRRKVIFRKAGGVGPPALRQRPLLPQHLHRIDP